VAMGAIKGQAATLQVEMVCLDELIAEDDCYRKLDRLIDWSFVRELAAPYYAEEVGRPSIDPIVLVKLMVAGALEGIGSTRELLRQASMRLDLRRFLGYGLSERLPVHQTLSHAHSRRFVDAALFERLFLRSLELCKQHGLVEGTHISIDGFHAEANAALASLRASLVLAAAPETEAGDDARGIEDGAPEPAGQLALDEARRRPGPRPERRACRARLGRAALGPDPEAQELECDLGLPQRPGGETARQARSAPPPRLPRPGGGRSQAPLHRRLPRRRGGWLRGRCRRAAARPRPLRLPRARVSRR